MTSSSLKNETSLYHRLTKEKHTPGQPVQKPLILNPRFSIESLTKEEINNVGALVLCLGDYAQKKANKQTGFSDDDEREYRKFYLYWLNDGRLTLGNKTRAFRLLCNSFKDVKTALAAQDIYYSFMTDAGLAPVDNPWTIQKAKRPGYAVIPYFQVKDPSFQQTLPAHAKDQVYYTAWRETLRRHFGQKTLEFKGLTFCNEQGRQYLMSKILTSFDRSDT